MSTRHGSCCMHMLSLITHAVGLNTNAFFRLSFCASAIGAMQDVLAGVDRTSLSLFRAARDLNRSVPAETAWD